MVLPLADPAESAAGGKIVAGIPQSAACLLENPLLVRFVSNGKTGQIPQFGDLAAQQSDAETVKSPQSDFFSQRRIHHSSQTFPHFCGGFVGKGQSQDLFRQDPFAEHISDPASDDPGLSGTGSGKDQYGAFYCFDGFCLFRIEPGDDFFTVHWQKIPCLADNKNILLNIAQLSVFPN